jgi:steroid 5-alpha reductase family enzyme
MGDLGVLEAAGIDLLICALVMGLTALVSWRVGRVSVVDVAWGLAFAAVALVLAVVSGHGHSWLLALLVTMWGVRLALHIFRRSRGHGEDPRYAALIGDAGFGTVIRKVFAVQGIAVFVVSLPLVTAAAHDLRWRWLVLAGAGLWLVGLVFEAVGDAQLATYRRLPQEQKPPIMQTGLWRYTRHPNYFGDACVWWGIWLAGALSVGWLPGLLTIVAPLAMTYFLAFATGARLLERTMMQRPGYPEYARRTSMLVPLPPRRG